MKRSQFIHWTAAAAAAYSIPFLPSCRSKPSNVALSHPSFLMRIMDKEELLTIGNDFLKLSKEDSTANQLEERLLASLGPSGKASSPNLSEFIDLQSTKDYDASRTLTLDGWIISVTEARQSALFALAAT